MIRFVYGDHVFVKSGFYKGRFGFVRARGLFQYLVKFNDDYCAYKWFWPWQIGKAFTIRPPDNKSTMENVRRAQEIVARVQAEAEMEDVLEASEK